MATGFRALGNKHVWVEETGEGPAIVGIHGLGGTCNIYGPQIAALASAHRFVTFDLNGHGMSPMVGPISIEGWADDTVALMDDLELSDAVLVAHSMGTLVAQQVMAIAGDRVRGRRPPGSGPQPARRRPRRPGGPRRAGAGPGHGRGGRRHLAGSGIGADPFRASGGHVDDQGTATAPARRGLRGSLRGPGRLAPT